LIILIIMKKMNEIGKQMNSYKPVGGINFFKNKHIKSCVSIK